MSSEKKVTKNLSELYEFAKNLSINLKNGGVVLLNGELGAGKTTLTKLIAENLGIEKFKIKSPTYTYIRKYKLNEKMLIHIDAYRINSENHEVIFEINELVTKGNNVILIEWGNNIKEHLDRYDLEIMINYVDKENREFIIHT